MNGKKAKILRKKAYGDMSLKADREYGFFTIVKKYITHKFNKKGERIIQDENRTTVVCKGFRKKYLELKKEYKQSQI